MSMGGNHDDMSGALSFRAAVVKLDAAQKMATFYIMNTSPNRNHWGVTEKALGEAAPTIKGKPIGSGKGYKLGHFSPEESMNHGSFVDQSVKGSYMTATAKISDDQVWSKLEEQEWGPISVVISYFGAECSECGANIMEEGFNHSHLQKGIGYFKVTSFKFDRVDFVKDPAYPQAGIMEMAQAEDLSPNILQLAAGYYHSTGGAPGSSDPDEKRKRQNMTEKTVEELTAELQEKAKELDKVKADLKTATETIGTLSTQMAGFTDLKDRLDRYEASRHQDLVNQVAQARFDADLCKDLEAEKEALKDRADADLGLLLADAKLVKEKIRTQTKPVIKATYDDDKDQKTALEAAFEDARSRLIPDPKALFNRLGAEYPGGNN